MQVTRSELETVAKALYGQQEEPLEGAFLDQWCKMAKRATDAMPERTVPVPMVRTRSARAAA
jgi:hypothetical protein